MKNTIIIIGGGISGLSVLHFLKKKYSGRDVDIILLEKNDEVGGTIRSQMGDHALFETGPNGFLASEPATFEVIRDLGIEGELIEASPSAQKRFLFLHGLLHEIPMGLVELWHFKPMRLREKFRLFKEFFILGKVDDLETVHDFATRRFGAKAAQLFFDPFVKGIFARDSKALNFKDCFPKLFELEMVHGSIIRGMRKKKKDVKQSMGINPRQLMSFKKGMGELVKVMGSRYRNHIKSFAEALDIRREGNSYKVQTIKGMYDAQEIFLCAPAFAASNILRNLNPNMAQALQKISYAPCAVVGLIYNKSSFKTLPQGFGYLTPSTEGKAVLGVLIENNIFEGRSTSEQLMLRIMIGGAHHPDIIQKSTQEIVAIAKEEIFSTFAVTESPLRGFISVWPKAIPQYTTEYVELKQTIINEIRNTPQVHLVSNYLGGVSFNDCIRNAQKTVAESEFAFSGSQLS